MVGQIPVTACTWPASLNFSSVVTAAAAWMNLPNRVSVFAKPQEGISIRKPSRARWILSLSLVRMESHFTRKLYEPEPTCTTKLPSSARARMVFPDSVTLAFAICGRKTVARVFAGIVTRRENGPFGVPFQSVLMRPYMDAYCPRAEFIREPRRGWITISWKPAPGAVSIPTTDRYTQARTEPKA